MVIGMLKKLTGRMNELSENLNKKIVNMKMGIETIQKNQSEVKDMLCEMKDTIEGISCRLDEARVRIRDLKHKVTENTQSEKQKE